MATKLTKDVVRETYGVTDFRGRTVIVTLKAGDMLEFRVKGRKIRYEVPLASCMNLAFIQFMEDRYKEKVKRYKERKSLGLRATRPKRPPRIYGDKWYKALKFK
jgi:hypothetical protein